MTKKDFELIALVIRELEDDAIRAHVAGRFAKELENANPRFNIVTWCVACNVPVILGAKG